MPAVELNSRFENDLVPRSRFGGSRTKKGEGRGKERRKRVLAKYDCVGQNLAHALTANLFFIWTVQITRCVLLLKTRFTKFKAKTQTVRDCKGCIVLGRHDLAVLPTGYEKTLTGLPVAAKHVGIFVPWWKNRFYHSCCFCFDGRPAFGFEEERGQSFAILTSDENLTILEDMAEADVRAGRASILFSHPEVLASNKTSGNCCFLNFIRKMLSVW